jgi:hypothetical protein
MPTPNVYFTTENSSFSTENNIVYYSYKVIADFRVSDMQASLRAFQKKSGPHGL